MVRVLLAPDKFKGTLTAAEVADHLGRGIRARRDDVEITTAPVADGGDGLLAACVAAGYDRVEVEAVDALGRPARTAFARRGDTAVVELAAVAGLAALGGRRRPLTATTRGVGRVVVAALDAGCRHVVLGIGGSASTDGGAGLVRALGARVTDGGGHDIADGGAALLDAAALDVQRLDPRLRDVRLEIASDVDNPLLGSLGAAAVYGPQKGATADQVALLDRALERWADVVATATGVDHRDDAGAGAAGGVGFGSVAILGAVLRPGVQLVLAMIGFAERLRGVDLVVTGEGSLDEQTLRGKAPVGVADAARRAGVPVIVVAGRCRLDDLQVKEAGFDAAYSLVDEAGSEQEALTRPGPLLERIGARIADGLERAS